MVIDLTKSEKITLYKFLALYLGSAFILLGLLATFFWQMQYNLQKELVYAKMKESASGLSARITHAHMSKNALDFTKLEILKDFSFALYDKDKKPIMSEISHKINFDKNHYQTKTNLGVIDTSVYGHMGIYFIVVEEHTFLQTVQSFTNKVMLAFILLFLLISAIGYWLSKLFIKPIQLEREKLNRFIKDSTHELNTPITALLMSTSSKDLTSEKNIGRIRLSATRISQLYEDLTYLFLLDIDKKDIQLIDFDKILHEQIELLLPFAKQKSIKIDSIILPTKIMIDFESASRLCSNLIQNAIKYSPKSTNITITLKDNKLIVKDRGYGIKKEKLSDIFQRFYRASEYGGGFGIGLNMVQTICQNYSIKIEVNSKVGKGSEFILFF